MSEMYSMVLSATLATFMTSHFATSTALLGKNPYPYIIYIWGDYFSWGVWVERVDVVELTILELPVLDSGVTLSDDVEYAESLVPSG